MKPILLGLALIFLSSCEKNAGLTVEKDPEKPVYHRQQAFKQILNAFEPMGLMIRNEKPFLWEDFKKYSAELKKISGSPWAFFKMNTNYPPSKTSNAVWEKKEVFQNEIVLFEKAVQAVNDAAFKENKAEIETTYQQLHQSCRSCHKQFRR